MLKSDVIVVGGGPAGSCAALELASRGVQTTLLEAKRVPGVPVRCGELVRKETMLSETAQGCARSLHAIKSCVFEGPFGSRLEFAANDDVIIISRADFDRRLIEQAADHGASVRLGHFVHSIEASRDGVVVRARTAGGEEAYKAKHVVGADGIGGRTGLLCGAVQALRPRRVATTASVKIENIEHDPSTAVIILDPVVAPGGYAWLFPIGGGVCSAGVGVNPNLANHHAAWYLKRLVAERIGPNSTVGRTVVGGIPAASESCTTRGVCSLAGDAGRAANGLTGAGIGLAVNTGTEVGRRLLSTSQGDSPLADERRRLGDRSLRARSQLSRASREKLAAAIHRASSQLTTTMSVASALLLIAEGIEHES